VLLCYSVSACTMELHDAAATDDDTRVQQLLLGVSASVDEIDNEGRTALMCASMDGHSASIELLLSASASVDQADNQGRTALMYSSRNGHSASTEMLLGASASVDQADNQGWTALMCASVNGHSASIELLLGASASVDQANNHGTTALMCASLNGHSASTELLLSASASVDQADNQGRTALMCASRNGHSASTEMLLGASASVDQAENQGRTALMYASRNNHHIIEELLISWPLLAPLMEAVVLRNPIKVRALLHLGADPMHTVELPSGTQSAWSLAMNDPAWSWANKTCTETMQLVQSSLTWSQQSHSLYPPGFRRGVRYLLASRQANTLTGNHLCNLPEPLAMLIISHLPRNWHLLPQSEHRAVAAN